MSLAQLAEVSRYDDLIVQGGVVVAVRVGDALLGSLCEPAVSGVGVRSRAVADVARVLVGARDEAAVGDIKYGTLDTVTDLVVEERDSAVEELRVRLRRLLEGRACAGLGGIVGGAACPAFAPHGDLLVNLVELGADEVHGLDIHQAHEVEAEAVDVILIDPVKTGLDDIISRHRSFCRDLIAAAGAVGEGAVLVHAIVVVRYGALKAGAVLIAGEGVVVNNVHDHRDARVVERLHHLLAFPDPHVAVGGIGGVGAFGNVVVLRIVAPVELVVIAQLVDGLEVIEGIELHGGNAELLEVIDTGGNLSLAFEGGILLGEGGELAAVRLADAGIGVIGEVFDMKLPDIGLCALTEENVLILLPAVGIGLGKIADHGALAVGACCHGIDILGLGGLLNAAHGMRRGDGVGVVGVDDVAAHIRLPYACPLVAVHELFHLNGAELFGARLGVGACGVAVENNLCRGR